MWSPDGPAVEHSHRAGWSLNGPDAPTIVVSNGWHSVSQRVAVDSAGGDDHALLDAALILRDGAGVTDSLYVGLDPAHDFEIRVAPRTNGVGSDRASVAGIDELVRDMAAAADLSRLGLRGLDSAGGGDRATPGLKVTTRDSGAGGDRATNIAKAPGRDSAGAGDLATGWFSPVAAALSTFTTVGTFTYTIPVWCRYIDLVGLGGGSGSNGGGTFAGDGGKASSWASTTIERGVHISWTATTLTVVVGAGGTAGAAFGGTGGTGGASYVQLSGTDLIRSAGAAAVMGTGVNRTGDAVSPSTITIDGVTYTGGAASTTDTASVPGSGGRGGGSFQAGRPGGRGQIWARARQ